MGSGRLPLSRSVPTWLVAGGSLVVGFVVAQGSGVRALGGMVLLVALGWCALLWHRRRGLPVAVGLAVVYVAGFVLAHVVAGAIGAVPAVLLAASVVAVTVFVVADRSEDREPAQSA